jgi:hypothetical protein
MPLMVEILIGKWFAFGASNRPRFLKSNSIISLRFFFHGDSHLVGDLKDFK